MGSDKSSSSDSDSDSSVDASKMKKKAMIMSLEITPTSKFSTNAITILKTKNTPSKIKH